MTPHPVYIIFENVYQMRCHPIYILFGNVNQMRSHPIYIIFENVSVIRFTFPNKVNGKERGGGYCWVL